MKQVFFSLLLLVCAVADAQQKPSVRINVYTGYVFDDHVDSYYSSSSYYSGTVKGNFQWGAGLELMLRPAQGIELTYLRMDTKAPTEYFDQGVKYRDFDVAANWILLGTSRYFKINQLVEPYIGAQLGLGIFHVSNPTNGNDNTATKFAWGLKGGTNLWVSKKVGIKVQAALQSATQAMGGGLYFGTGGAGVGVTSYSTIYQFSLGGGLAFRL